MSRTTKPIVVIDTNILVSAFILPASITRRAFDKAILKCTIVFSESTADELRSVMKRPKFDKHLSNAERMTNVNDLISLSSVIVPNVTIAASRDQKDNQFLELAVSAKADYIISGDKDLLILNPFRGIPILTASEFFNYAYD